MNQKVGVNYERVYSIRELRAVALGEAAFSDFDYPNGTLLTEAAIREMFSLNEAYYGKATLKEIDEIMCRIERKIAENPLVDIYREPEGDQLNEAIVKAFGFKSCHVYWMRDPNMGNIGPCTLPAARVMDARNKGMKYGSFNNGVYDKDHVMTVFVQMDNALVTECHLTGAEMTAALVHELGHNFDFTPFALINRWFDVVTTIINGILTGRIDQAAINLLTAAAIRTPAGRKIYMEVMNLSDTIGKIIPPIGVVMYGLQVAISVVNKILNMILVPVIGAVQIPRVLFGMPFSYVANFFRRKSETYADSMAAVYGYGPEQVSALEKLTVGMSTLNNAPRGLFVIFDNITLAYQEIMALAIGGHGSNQQRALRMLDNLKREVNSSELDSASKKACQEEIARLEDTYQKMIGMDDDNRRLLTKMVRGLMDQWYAGTAPNLLPIMSPEYTYVK